MSKCYEQLSTNLKYKLSSQWGEFPALPCMKEIYRISKFTNLESSTFFRKRFFCVHATDFLLFGNYIYFTKHFSIWNKFEDLLRQARISVQFNSDKNIISKRDNLKTKESYVWQISNVIRFKDYELLPRKRKYLYITNVHQNRLTLKCFK